MGQSREHAGHSGATQARITEAREWYMTRATRRPRQVWEPEGAAIAKVPRKVVRNEPA